MTAINEHREEHKQFAYSLTNRSRNVTPRMQHLSQGTTVEGSQITIEEEYDWSHTDQVFKTLQHKKLEMFKQPQKVEWNTNRAQGMGG